MNTLEIEAREVSISSIGEALVALDAEIARLEQEACQYYKRIAYVTEKQRICQAAIKRLLCDANGGQYPPRITPAFIPELNHRG